MNDHSKKEENGQRLELLLGLCGALISRTSLVALPT